MPWTSITAAPDNLKIHQGAKLTLAQINKWAEIYDAVKASGSAENPAAVAWAQWEELYRKEGDHWVAKEKKANNAVNTDNVETYSKDDVEIFATGTWNGEKYTDEDLENMVDNFEFFKNRGFKVPLKLGHDRNQKLAQKDGLPALGWITSLKKVGNKLVAKIEGIPKLIKSLIERGAYGRFSSEIFWNFKYNGNIYRRVLCGVALLGADVPAVSSISDIVGMFSQKIFPEQPIHAYGLDAKYYQEGDIDMNEIEKLQAQLKEQEEKMKKLSTDAETWKKEKEKLQAEIEEKEKEKQAVEIFSVLDKAVEEGKLPPVLREKFAALLLAKEENGVRSYSYKEGDAEKVIKFSDTFELVKSILNEMPQFLDKKTYTKTDNSGKKINDKDENKKYVKDEKSMRVYATDEDLDEKARKLMEKDKELTYREALALAQKEGE